MPHLDAASARRLDLVEVLLASGANIKSVPLVDVLLTWEPEIICFFLNRGCSAPDKLGCQIIRCVEVTHCVQPPNA